MAHYQKYINKKYYHITVISFAGWRDSKQFWKCICDCGKELFLEAENLQRGKPKSCGCATDPTSEIFKNDALNRILSQIEKTEDCWIWKGKIRKGFGKYKDGFYPYCNFNHVQYSPVKFFKMMINDELPKNWAYKRKCYTKNCVNPEHYEKISISRIRYPKKENL